ncbi:MAG: EcsC family protein [Propionibacteriaceae bacterium]|nr:EcsC family protein [Propionibacteriaceae bacterium]
MSTYVILKLLITSMDGVAMGLLDLFRRNKTKDDIATTRSALQAAQDPDSDAQGAVSRLIAKLLDIGIDGRGPFPGAAKVAEKARGHRGTSSRDVEKSIDRLVGQHVRGGAAGGFATSLGGFVTMPVAVPVNVFEFYVQATRMVAGIAHLRGYDILAPEVRTAVLLTLIGNDATEVLKKAGVPAGPITGGAATSLVVGRLPKSALMVVNKAVGFRLLRSVGERTLTKFGKLIPVAGGVLGAALDGFLMRQLGQAARKEFPAR